MQSSPSWTAFSSGGLTEEESPSKLIQVAGRLCVLVALLLRGPSFLSGCWVPPCVPGEAVDPRGHFNSLSHGLLQQGILVHEAARGESISSLLI